MEFSLSTNITQSIPTAIVFNYEELRSELQESIQPYKALVVTLEDIKDAKSDRAKLNKLKTALNDKKKEVKQEYMTPYTLFETQIKDLMKIIDEGISNIDEQVEKINQAELKKKYEELKACYESAIGNYADLLPFEKVLPVKWENKTVTVEKAKQDIVDLIEQFDRDMKTIMSSQMANKQVVIDAYVQNPFDLGSAMAKANQQESQQNALKKAFGSKYNHTVAETQKAETEQTDEVTKDIEVVFYNTTKEFRKEMKALCEKHGVIYEGR